MRTYYMNLIGDKIRVTTIKREAIKALIQLLYFIHVKNHLIIFINLDFKVYFK